MQVLLTGAYGTIGRKTIEVLLDRGYSLVTFDLDNSKNHKWAKTLRKSLKKEGINLKNIKTIWGDLLDYPNLNNLIASVDCVIHLAGVIPNLSETNPKLATRVNVEGTRLIIKACEAADPSPRLIFSSSVTVHGPTMHLPSPITHKLPYNPQNHYATTKVNAEKLVKASSIPWVIFRFTATFDYDLTDKLKPSLIAHNFEIPLNQRIEFLDVRDAACALVNSVEKIEEKQIFLVGGGPACQLYQRDMVQQIMVAMGIGRLPKRAFLNPKNDTEWYPLNWLDTKEVESILKFQKHSSQDYIYDLKQTMWKLRIVIKMFRPFVRRFILNASPYYNK
ncbi:MAG: NAD-dependent epimerase/dehydratase family protein [Promethearchaeota archaeon]